jgi:F-type H+-transporting ATPase subunit epsilon
MQKGMRLKVLLPSGIIVDEAAVKVNAEAENGLFTLLPRHIDFVAALLPGLLSFETAEGAEEFLAIDEGVLVKCGPDVLVSTRNALRGGDLGALRETIEEEFKVFDDRQRMVKSAAARLEADLVRRFMQLD